MSELIADFKGVVTAPGLLLRNRASFIVADNALFHAPGVVGKRKGYGRQPETVGAPIFKLLTSRLTGDNAIIHYGATSTGGTDLRYGDGSTPVASLNTIDSSSVTRPLDTKMQMAMAQRNHYVTADEGMRRIESDVPASAVRYAGMPRGMSVACSAAWVPTTVLNVWIGASLLPDGFARAYRVTWHRKDADGNVLSGPPTARVIVRNQTGSSGYTGNPADVNCVIPLPQEFGTTGTALTTDYYWRLWACRTYDATAALPDGVGDDEMWLVAQANVTSTDLSNGYATYADATPDGYLVAAPTLNTNAVNFPDGEQGLIQGIVNADDPPPIANAVAQWQDVLWAADISYRPRISLALIANMVDGDTFNAGAVLLTARAVPTLPTDFQILAAGGGVTTDMAIEGTARNFCECLNLNSTEFYAYYVSPPGQFGQVYIEQRQPSSPVLQVYSSASWRPDIASATDLAIDAQSNVLAYGKPLRGDSFPVVNVLSAGPADNQIVQLVPFRDMLVVFTTYGIYRVTGRTFADFSVSILDATYRLLSRDSVVVCDDRVYAWCFEGIIEIDPSTSISVISTPIEPTVAEIRNTVGDDSTFAALAFAVAYRQKHRVLFFYPEADDLPNLRGCGLWLVYDTRTQCWSSGFYRKDAQPYRDNRSTAVIRWSDDRVMQGNWNEGSTDSYLFLENNSGLTTDYLDTNASGTSYPVALGLSLQYQIPVAEGAVHWQATVVSWDGGEFAGRDYPTAFIFTWGNERTSTSFTSSNTTPIMYVRAEPGLETRRSNRMLFSIVNAEAEYCGVVGISQEYSLSTRFVPK